MGSLAGVNWVQSYGPGRDARINLKNGRFVDVMNGGYFGPEVSLVLKGGRIEAMPGLPGQPAPEPDFTIDLKGRAVMPGIFNTHCHANVGAVSLVPGIRELNVARKFSAAQKARNMAECVARGITNIRDAYTGDLRLSRALKESISKGGMPGPRIIQSVVVGPPGSYLAEKLSVPVRLMMGAFGMPRTEYSKPDAGVVEFPVDAGENEVRAAVDRAVDERGAEAIKVGEQRENVMTLKADSTVMTLKQLEVLADQARRRGLKTLMHHVSVDSFRRGAAAGVSSLSHIATDGVLTLRDIEAFRKSGCVIEPTLSVGYAIAWNVEGSELYDHPAMSALTGFRDRTYTCSMLADDYFIPELKGSLVGSHEKMSAGRFNILGFVNLKKLFTYYANGFLNGQENFRKLFDQDACIALANDGGVPPCTPGSLALEITFLGLCLDQVPGSRKMTGAEAVRIATINSARSMGLEKDFGSIEPGKVADLALYDGDPLQDYHLLGTRVAALFMDGRLVIDNCGLAGS